MTTRSEKIDTRAVLNGDLGRANGTDQDVRRAEAYRVWAYWPSEMLAKIRDGFLVAPEWRMLTEATAFSDVDPERVHDFVRDQVRLRGRWPTIDEVRRRFGRVTNHRGPDEIDEQTSMKM